MSPFRSLLDFQRRRYAAVLELCRTQLASVDDIALRVIEKEIERQAMINLVASESQPSLSVMAASAHPGYTQTVEGRIGERWYPAGDPIDELEQVAGERARELFHFPGGNLQPHTATQANQAVYFSSLKRDDTILAAAFTSGAHLSHGARASLARALYNVEYYRVPSFEGSLTLEHLEQRICCSGSSPIGCKPIGLAISNLRLGGSSIRALAGNRGKSLQAACRSSMSSGPQLRPAPS